jgi:hypothetical protein
MARRSSADSSAGVAIIVIICIAFAVYRWIEQNVLIASISACALLGLFIAYKAHQSNQQKIAWERRSAYLLGKYKKQDIVDKILNREYWKGQTTDQLEDSIGAAHAVDRQVLKTKTKETWKYHEVKRGQFSTRIEIENGKVVDWSAKD